MNKGKVGPADTSNVLEGELFPLPDEKKVEVEFEEIFPEPDKVAMKAEPESEAAREPEKLQELVPVAHKSAAYTPMDLILRAQETGATVEKLEQLFALQVKWEENEAKKAYYRAVAAFKAEAIDIVKTRKVSYRTDKGLTEYNHAELGVIVNIVTPAMSKHGLSHHWEYEQKPDGKIKVTCFLTHELGYERSTFLEAPPDASGGKNSIQAMGSTTSYLEKYTFLAMTGLAAREQDDDGNSAGRGEKEMVPVITEVQEHSLLGLLAEVGVGEKPFCAYWKIAKLADLPAEKFTRAVEALETKRKTPKNEGKK